jgi:peptidoglycan hydrolase-like amidase/uncharacterized protein YoxC
MKLPSRILAFIVILILVLSLPLVNSSKYIFADDLEKIEKEIDETEDKINELAGKIDSIKGDINNLSGSLEQVLATVRKVEGELNEVVNIISEVNLNLNTKSALLVTQTVIRDRTLRNFYKKGPNTALATIVKSNSLLSSDTDTSSYLKKYIDDSSDFIAEVNIDILTNKRNKEKLEIVKSQVEEERAKILAIKVETEKKLAEQQAELEKNNANLGELNSKLSGLQQRQKEILAAKEGNFYASLGSGVETDDANASPNYNPGFSPAYAAFSYGAYTHYKGMSQYGAKGRAEDGKDYEDIIKFYYKESVKEKDDFPDRVCVEGHGEMDFQKYLYGLAEMPDSFPTAALKAQAIAGRSYAYRYQKQGKCICTSQSCQVFLKSKSDNPPSKWKEAVDDTEGKIVGGDVVTYYSSTTGGYIQGIGWDKDGDWPGDAYERKGGSPWFYKGWYTKSYSKNSDKCGKDHPWLDEEEMADIINAYLYLSKVDSDSKVSPVTTSCWGGDPYSNYKACCLARLGKV